MQALILLLCIFCLGQKPEVKIQDRIGLHVELSSIGLEKLKSLNVLWVRGADQLKWGFIQPTKTDWEFPDSLVDLFLDNGVNILVNLGLTPKWASSNPNAKPYPNPSKYFGSAVYPPKRWEDWGEYVDRLTKKYPAIKYWEVLNETDIHYMLPGNDTRINVYEKYLNFAIDKIKKNIPGSYVLAPAFAYYLYPDVISKNTKTKFPADSVLYYRDTTFVTQWLRQGEHSKYDIFTFHHYSYTNHSIIELYKENQLKNKITSLKKITSINKVWITEYNVLDPYYKNNGIPRYLRIARQMVIEQLLLFDAGIDKIFTYAAYNQTKKPTSFYTFYDTTGKPTEVFNQFKLMLSQLGNLTLLKVDKISSNIYTAKFNGSKKLLVIFSLSNKSFSYQVDHDGLIVTDANRYRKIKKGDRVMLEPYSYFYMHY